MSRLTYLNQDTEDIELTSFADVDYSWRETIEDEDVVIQIDIENAIEKLYEYEEAEEQGLLVKLPCKVGTTAYVVGTRCLAGEEPENGCVFLDCEECIYDKNYTIFETKVDNMMMYHFLVGDNRDFIFNKTVFLTREEAEKELKRMECAECKE